jgi:antitoxin component YwqK of YwqJK toxin-antitoxin module
LNGRKQGEITYEDGKLEGLANEWDENGQKRRERTYKDGERVSN